MNGRNHTYPDQNEDKCKDEKPFENVEKPFNTKNASSPMDLFAKPFKVPASQEHSKKRPTNHMDMSIAPAGSGGDVSDILKMMTASVEPLSKIAATPRTEIEVQQPNKQHIYAGLPPIFRPPTNPSKYLNRE